MTLISNKYKFIYIKTHRTSSTATQEFLKKFCDEIYEKPSNLVKKGDLYNHSTAKEIKLYLIKNNRKNIWDTYRKICIIRNPYSVLLSYYGWCLIRKIEKYKDLDFNDFLKNIDINEIIENNLLKKICIDDKIIIDDFIVYEKKEITLNKILNELNIKEKYNDKNFKKINNFISPFNSSNYKEKYNENLIEYVNNSKLFKKYNNIYNKYV